MPVTVGGSADTAQCSGMIRVTGTVTVIITESESESRAWSRGGRVDGRQPGGALA